MPDESRDGSEATAVPLTERSSSTDFWDRVQRRVEAHGTDLPPEDILRLRADDRI